MPGLFAYSAYSYFGSAFGALSTSLSVYLGPVVGAVLSIIFLGEAPTNIHLIGGVLSLGGMWLSLRRKTEAEVSMKLASIPRQSRSRRGHRRHGQDARWRGAALRALGFDAGKGTVCVFGGRGEFIEKYFETISELRQRGFAVAIMDWRGQGHSSRQLPDRAQGACRRFRGVRDRPRDLHAASGAADIVRSRILH